MTTGLLVAVLSNFLCEAGDGEDQMSNEDPLGAGSKLTQELDCRF